MSKRFKNYLMLEDKYESVEIQEIENLLSLHFFIYLSSKKLASFHFHHQPPKNHYWMENLVLIVLVESPRVIGVEVDDTYESVEIQEIENLYFLKVEVKEVSSLKLINATYVNIT
ncbi:hypothetical protein QL285_052625 [Trifolium repens]|nr:hypothetical protein QL285_052625 [Trifolium repens]